MTAGGRRLAMGTADPALAIQSTRGPDLPVTNEATQGPTSKEDR